jgi:hypothetical protein
MKYWQRILVVISFLVFRVQAFYAWLLKMGPTCCPETSVANYQLCCVTSKKSENLTLVTSRVQYHYIYIYIYRFQNIFLRCPTPRLHCFLSSHWPSFRYLSFMAFLTPSIQFFFGLPRALFCFGINFSAILGNLPSAIFWTWPCHVSWLLLLQTDGLNVEYFFLGLRTFPPVPVAVHLQRSWVRIPPGGMDVCCEYCVLSSRGPCVGLITHPEEPYWVCVCVWVSSWIPDSEEALAH